MFDWGVLRLGAGRVKRKVSLLGLGPFYKGTALPLDSTPLNPETLKPCTPKPETLIPKP